MKRTASICILVMLAAALMVLGTGCAGGPPKDEPGITGTVTDLQVEMESQTVVVLVTGQGSEKAQITLTDETKVFGPDGAEARAVDLNKGMQVKVWYDGPVAESDPVQAKAAALQMME
jgi:hypothetical protein